jgi:hypothetical protein
MCNPEFMPNLVKTTLFGIPLLGLLVAGTSNHNCLEFGKVRVLLAHECYGSYQGIDTFEWLNSANEKNEWSWLCR